MSLFTVKDGIHLLNTFNTTITNVTICYTLKDGIHVLNSSNTTITSIIIHYTSRVGIEMIGSSGSTISNVQVIESEDGILMKYNTLVKINNPNITNCKQHGIYMEQSQGIEVNGSVVLNSFTGIHIRAVNDINITGCTIKHTSSGIYMYDNHQINLIEIQVLHTEFRAIRVHRVIHSRIIDVNLIYGSTPSTVALDLYSVVDNIIKSLTIINWTNTAVFASEVNNATLVHLLLTTTHFTTYTMNNFRGIVLYLM